MVDILESMAILKALPLLIYKTAPIYYSPTDKYKFFVDIVRSRLRKKWLSYIAGIEPAPDGTGNLLLTVLRQGAIDPLPAMKGVDKERN